MAAPASDFLQRRTRGPELIQTICQVTGSQYRHFFVKVRRVPIRFADTLRSQFQLDRPISSLLSTMIDSIERALSKRLCLSRPNFRGTQLSLKHTLDVIGALSG